MNEHLRDRILRKLDTLSDERGYQVLDYVEFLESKYAERPQPSAQSTFTRFAEAVEDRMRAGKMSAQTITETMGLLNRAVGILNGVGAAGRSAMEDLMSTVNAAATVPPGSGGGQGTPSASSAGSAPAPAADAAPSDPTAPRGPGEGPTTQGGGTRP